MNFASLPDSSVHGRKPTYIESSPALLHNVNLLSHTHKELPLAVPFVTSPKEPPDHLQVTNIQLSEPEDSPSMAESESSDEQDFLLGELSEEDSCFPKAAFSLTKLEPKSACPSQLPSWMRLEVI